MSKRPLVHCRVCKQEIDRDILEEDVEWVQPSKNWYYHIGCYENYAKKKVRITDDIHAEVDNSLWFDALYDYLVKDLKVSLNMVKTLNQWENWLKKGYTGKGIYFAMRYFYDILKSDTKKGDGIGIVSYIYADSCQYWVNREEKDKGICKAIEDQIKIANQQKKIIIKQKPKEKKIPKTDFGEIYEMGDDE